MHKITIQKETAYILHDVLLHPESLLLHLHHVVLLVLGVVDLLQLSTEVGNTQNSEDDAH